MSFPRIRTLQWDESATSNLVTVPFGHVWEVRYLFMQYVASADVATRSMRIGIDHDVGPLPIILLQIDITASLTKEIYVGAQDQNNPLDGSQELPHPLWLVNPDKIVFTVTSEQGADTWDVWAGIKDWVVPRA